MVYKLTSREFQVNTVSNAEGKVFVYIFSLDPLTLVQNYTLDT